MRDKLVIIILVVMGLAGQFAPACLSGSNEIRLEGVLYTKNTEKNLFILKSGDCLYKFSPKNANEMERLRSGDSLVLTAIQDANRKFVLHDATFKIVYDKTVTTVLWAKLSSGGWHDGLFRVLTSNDEYWQVNFISGEGTAGLKSETYYTFRGAQDHHLSQTINNASVYDTVRRKISLLKVVSVDAKTGWLETKNTSDNDIRVYSTDAAENLANMKKDDFIRVEGYQDVKDSYGPILFASVCTKNPCPETVSVEFVGEVLDVPSKINGNKYSIRECDSVINFEYDGPNGKSSIGNWVKVKGSYSLKERLCIPSSITLTNPAIICTVFERDPVSRDLRGIEPEVNIRWNIQLSEKSRSKSVPLGTMLKVSSSSYLQRRLIGCKTSDVVKISGMIIDIDYELQTATIESVAGEKTTTHIRPEVVDLLSFNYEDQVEVYGLHATKSSQEGHIFECVLKKASK